MHKNYIKNILLVLLRKVFMLTTSGRKQSSSNCEHITQQKLEMSIIPILNILNQINCLKMTK